MSEIVLTLKEAVELWPALCELAQGKEIPAKTSYRLGKIHGKLKVDIEGYEKSRMALFERLGIRDEEKDMWSIKAGNMDEFTKEMEQLGGESITLDGVMKVEFDDISHLDFKPASIMSLEPLINGLE